MIYKFKCPATATVHMNTAMAELLLKIAGRSPAEKGVITVQDMPAVIDALKAANSTGTRDGDGAALTEQRQPLIRMLEEARSAGQNVTWGV